MRTAKQLQKQKTNLTAPSKNNQKTAIQAVEFPTIVINDVNTFEGSPFAQPLSKGLHLNTRDSINLNSVLTGDLRESFLKSNDTLDPTDPTTTVSDFNGGGILIDKEAATMKIECTFPKFTSLINLNKTPGLRKSADSTGGGSSPLHRNVLRPHSSSTRNQRNETLESYDSFDQSLSPADVPRAKAAIFSTRPTSKASISPRQVNTTSNLAVAAVLPTKSNDIDNFTTSIIAGYASLLPDNTKKTYTDPLTQEKTLLNDEMRITMKERNNSLKELLVDALEDFYVQHENLRSETDDQTLQKAGLPPTEIKAIHEEVANRKINNQQQFMIKPNLVTVQVSKNKSNSYDQQDVTIFDNSEKQSRSVQYTRASTQMDKPLVYEVRQMFDEEIFPQDHLNRIKMMLSKSEKVKNLNGSLNGPLSAREAEKQQRANHRNNQQRKRPNSSHVLAATRHRNDNSYDDKPPFQTRKPKEKASANLFPYLVNEDATAAAGAESNDLFINSKPYHSHPLHHYHQQKEIGTKPRIENNDEIGDDFKHAANRQLISPRTTTIMLLSHEILSKHEQALRGNNAYPTAIINPLTAAIAMNNNNHNNNNNTNSNPQRDTALKRSFDVPVNILAPSSANPYLIQHEQKQRQQHDPTSLSQPRNQKRILQIVETELLNQQIHKSKGGTTGRRKSENDATNEKSNISEDLLLPDELATKMKKQLSRYNELVQQQQLLLAVDAGGEESMKRENSTSTGLNANYNLFGGITNEQNRRQQSQQHETDEEEENIPEGEMMPRLQWKGFLHAPATTVPTSTATQDNNSTKENTGINSAHLPEEKEENNDLSKKLISEKMNNNKILIDKNHRKNNSYIEISDNPYNRPLNNANSNHPYQHHLNSEKSTARGGEGNEIDHDFMNIPDDLYLNDSLYYTDKGNGSPAMISSATNPQQQQQQIIATPMATTVVTAPIVITKEQETVKLNKNIPSERIDMKYNQSLHYPTPQQSPMVIKSLAVTANSSSPLQLSVLASSNNTANAAANDPITNSALNSPRRLKHLTQLTEKEKEMKRLQMLKIETASMKLPMKPVQQQQQQQIPHRAVSPSANNNDTNNNNNNNPVVTSPGNKDNVIETIRRDSPNTIGSPNSSSHADAHINDNHNHQQGTHYFFNNNNNNYDGRTIYSDTVPNLSSSQRSMMHVPALRPAPPPISTEFHHVISNNYSNPLSRSNNNYNAANGNRGAGGPHRPVSPSSNGIIMVEGKGMIETISAAATISQANPANVDNVSIYPSDPILFKPAPAHLNSRPTSAAAHRKIISPS